MKNITKFFLILLIFIVTIGCFLISNDNLCYADSSITFYHEYISDNGQITTTAIGSQTYTLVSNAYYRYSLIDDTSSGITYFKTQYNCSNVKLINTSDAEMTITSKTGYYITAVTQGTPAKGYVYNPYYTISYELDGGSNNSNNPKAFDSTTSTLTLYEPTKSGYKFDGWALNSSSGQVVTSIEPSSYSSNITLYAKWIKLDYIDVHYLHTDKTTLFDDIVDSVSIYLHSTSAFYVYSDNLLDKKNELGLENLVIYNENGDEISITTHSGMYISTATQGKPAKIEIKDTFYSITYNLNGGTNPNTINYYFIKDDLNEILDPSKDGNVFIGWYLDESFSSTFTSSSFTEQDISLYARWSEIKYIDVTYKYTDNYSILEEVVDTVSYYLKPTNNLYYYSSNLKDSYTNLSCSIFEIKSSSENIEILTHNGNYVSKFSQGEVESICISYPIYSITYVLNEGEFDTPCVNYYVSRESFYETVSIPSRAGYKFHDWYFDEEFNNPYRTSDFVEQNVTLYAKWSKLYPIDVFYYNSAIENPDYEHVGQINYYTHLDVFYCYGSLSDTSEGIGYYLDKYNTTSFCVLDKDGKRLNATTSNGNCLTTISSGEPNAVFIYIHYNVKFYINGMLYSESKGQPGDDVTIPNDIEGFIGKNHDAIEISGKPLGNKYAVYLFKGWSLTDTSDRSWFNKESVEMYDTTDMKFVADGNYMISLYAYMTFYKKTSDVNSTIDYESYIAETNGIIKTTSKYSIDDLILEHATEISSDTELSNIEKIAKALGLSSDHPFVKFLGGFFNNSSFSIQEISSNIFWKILIIACLVFLIITLGILTKTFIKSRAK